MKKDYSKNCREKNTFKLNVINVFISLNEKLIQVFKRNDMF